jgi:nucleoside-diphosphate-sugar epimerase
VRDLLKRVGAMIDIEPIIEEDPVMPAPVPLRYVSNITRISDELGWQPQIGVDDGLRVIL